MEFRDFLVESGIRQTKTAKGEIPFASSDGSEAYNQTIISMYAADKGITLEAANQVFVDRVKANVDGMSKLSSLYEDMIRNVGDTVTFGMLEEINLDSLGTDLFNIQHFSRLVQYVIGENSEFFPLKNPFESQTVKPMFFVFPVHAGTMPKSLIPNAKKSRTAFCTINGTMVFNLPFTKRLLAFAKIKGIVPKSVKYVSNGKDIPDHYCLVETVIVHELMHFVAGDFFYMKRDPSISHDIYNHTSDFINNFKLLASGYEQLPMGLWSDSVNYDRFERYDDIIKFVKDAFDEIEPEKREEAMKDMNDKGADDHFDENGNDTKEDGYEPTEKPNKDDKKEEPGKDGQPGDKGDPKDDGEPTDDGHKQKEGKGNGKKSLLKPGMYVKDKATGKKMMVKSASEPDENGKQTITVVEVEEN